MKKKEDIASLIKQKFEASQLQTDLPQWEAVSKTLGQRKRQRQAVWWIGSVMSLALILFFVQNFNNDTTLAQPEKGVNESNQLPSKDPVKNLNEAIFTVVTEDSTAADQNQSANKSPSSDQDDSNKNNKQQKKTPLKQVSVTQFDSVDITQGAQVKTTYYYYRDSDKTEVITQNKRVLDSLLELGATQISKDSI